MTAAALLDAAAATPAGGCDELPGDELIRRFEACEIPGDRFRHADHVRLAWEYQRRFPAAEALARIAGGLRRFAAAHGSPDRYHETITWAYLALIREAMQGRADADSEAFLAAHPDLLDHRGGALARRYDVAALTADPAARRVFVLPTRPR